MMPASVGVACCARPGRQAGQAAIASSTSNVSSDSKMSVVLAAHRCSRPGTSCDACAAAACTAQHANHGLLEAARLSRPAAAPSQTQGAASVQRPEPPCPRATHLGRLAQQRGQRLQHQVQRVLRGRPQHASQRRHQRGHQGLQLGLGGSVVGQGRQRAAGAHGHGWRQRRSDACGGGGSRQAGWVPAATRAGEGGGR